MRHQPKSRQPQGVAAQIAASFVTRLVNIDILTAESLFRAIDDFGSHRKRVSPCQGLSAPRVGRGGSSGDARRRAAARASRRRGERSRPADLCGLSRPGREIPPTPPYRPSPVSRRNFSRRPFSWDREGSRKDPQMTPIAANLPECRDQRARGIFFEAEAGGSCPRQDLAGKRRRG